MKHVLRLTSILVMIAVISTLHYQTDTDHLYLHELYQRIYYIPILLAAFWYGWLGGAVAASLTSGLYIFHIKSDWVHMPAYTVNQYGEIFLYYGVALITGFLAGRERGERRKLQATTVELGRAYDRLRQASEQLRRSERLAGLGALTAGIAHEIRNPLGSIKGAVEILDEHFPADHPQREFLDIVKEEITRLNSTLSEFLRFASPRPIHFQPCSLNQMIETTVTLLKRQSGKTRVVIDTDLDAALPEMQADSDQIRQILLNVILNGIQAMPDGGTLHIRSVLEPDRKMARVEVTDAGTGIGDTDLEQAFDPFFTTKSSGMGLGLSISHQLVLNHGGTILLKPNPGQGLTVRIRLPVNPHEALLEARGEDGGKPELPTLERGRLL